MRIDSHELPLSAVPVYQLLPYHLWPPRHTLSINPIFLFLSSPPGPMKYLHGLALRIWTSFRRREGSAGMDMWNTPVVQSRQPFTYRLGESMGLGGPRWHGSSWQRGIAEGGSSRLSTLMIEICGDLVCDLPWVQQASYLEGGPLMWMLPLYLHVNQKSDYDMILLGFSCWLFWSIPPLALCPGMLHLFFSNTIIWYDNNL